MGPPANFGIAPSVQAPSFAGNARPVLILSGSCSRATNAQIAAYRAHAPSLQVGADVLTNPEKALATVIGFFEANRNAAPLVYSTANPADVAALQAKHGTAALASAFDLCQSYVMPLGSEPRGWDSCHHPLCRNARRAGTGVALSAAGVARHCTACPCHCPQHAAFLLANQGLVVSGPSFADAVCAAEELEETAKLLILTHGRNIRYLSRNATVR
jgi:Nucleotide-binding C-terminal domain